MRPGSIFVHCGSGATVDAAAMLAALRAGHLAGAALDTYTYEPLRAGDPLVAAVQDPALDYLLALPAQIESVLERSSGARARRAAEAMLARQHRLLQAISRAQAMFIASSSGAMGEDPGFMSVATAIGTPCWRRRAMGGIWVSRRV